MHIIDSSAAMAKALGAPISDTIKRLLALRRDQLCEFESYDLGELGRWLIVESGDTLTEIEAAAGILIANACPSPNPDHAPPWEWVLDHGNVYEAPIIMSDDGFGTVLIVPDQVGIDPTLLRLLRTNAETAEPLPRIASSGGSDRH
jgi:hypothetical protein